MRIIAALIGGMLLLPSFAAGKTCLMMYQVADNNLEFFIRQDYQELISSPVISSQDLRVWAYYDALNQGGTELPNTVDSSGNVLRGTYTGARYMTYDPGFGNMRVDVEVGTENSDAATTMQDFMEHAMDDCLNNGYDSLMAVFAGHGGGFAGYGGDENVRGRSLLQTNQGVASAVRGALDNTPGAPDKLEVIGFDACNMLAFEAADDYVDVAQYMLASEALEPGHGWAYIFLNTATSALELAKQIVSEYMARTQGGSYHQAPKTLAVLDLAKYETFLSNFESLSDDLLSSLQGGDVSLHSFVSRARATSVAFEGVLDATGSPNPAGLDIGSWLYRLSVLCNPAGDVGNALQAAIDAYWDMFVVSQNGPGSAGGTGMHIIWPDQGTYYAQKQVFDAILFQNSNYVTQIAPNFRGFLQFFLNSAVPAVGNLGDSVCGPEAVPAAGIQADPDALIISDEAVIDEGTSTFSVSATIGASVSQMVLEYALDLTTPLKPVLIEKGYEPEDDEYLLLKGGDIQGTYDGSQFSASWNEEWYFLNISGSNTFEALYVFDEGEYKRIPVMFFPEANRSAVAELQFLDYLFFDFDYWVEQGARFSFLAFSTNETEGRINQNLALYISNGDNGYAEHPKEAGGLLMPLIYIDAYIQGRKLDTLPGGFNQTIVEWNTELDYNILTTSSSQIFNIIPATDAVVVNMYAHNYADPDLEPDVRYYDVIRPTRKAENTFTNSPLMATREPVAEDDAQEPAPAAADSGSNSKGLGLMLLLLSCLGLLVIPC